MVGFGFQDYHIHVGVIPEILMDFNQRSHVKNPQLKERRQTDGCDNQESN